MPHRLPRGRRRAGFWLSLGCGWLSAGFSLGFRLDSGLILGLGWLWLRISPGFCFWLSFTRILIGFALISVGFGLISTRKGTYEHAMVAMIAAKQE